MRTWKILLGLLFLCGVFYGGLPFLFGFGQDDWGDFYGTDLFVVLPVILFPWLVAGIFFFIRTTAGGSSRSAYAKYLFWSVLIVLLIVPFYYFFGVYFGPKRR